MSILDEVERRSAIPRSMTYLVHHGKVLNEKRTTEENNIGTETTIDMSLRLLGGMEKSELMDTLESEEDREKKRSWRKRVKVKLTRPSEDAMFLEKRNNRRTQKVTQEKPTKRWKSFYKKSQIQSEHNYTG